MAEQDILAKLETIRNLPTLPDVIRKLGTEIKNPNADATRVAGIIENDPAIMTRVLKVVNSAFFGAAEPITSVKQAVARMGFNAVNNIAMSTSIFSTMDNIEHSDFDRKEFWRHCISTGIAAGVLYDHASYSLSRQYSTDMLHLVGLIHDIGKIIFEQFFHEEFMAAIRESAESKVPLVEAETNCIGASHTWVGAWLGRKWNLSEELVEAIEWHHDPNQASDANRELVTLSHCANYICNLQGSGNSGDCAAPQIRSGAWSMLGLVAEDIASVASEVEVESQKSEVLLSMV